MKFYQNKLKSFNLIAVLSILITHNYIVYADSFADMIFHSIGESFGINTDKIDKSYNNVTISNSLISNLTKNIYYKNNSIVSNNIVHLSEEQHQSDISVNYYQHITTAKYNKTTEDYSKITHNIGSINIDNNFGSMINFGCGYGFANTKSNIYERKTKKHLGSDKITTHVGMLYGYNDFSMINTNITFMGAISKHNINSDIIKNNNYNSHFFSANLNSELDSNLLLFGFHILCNLGLAKVYSNKTEISNNSIDKLSNNLFNFGLSFTTNSKLDIRLMALAYRLSLGYQVVHIRGDIVGLNKFFLPATSKLQPVDIKQSPPLMHNLIAEVNLSLQIYDYLQIAGDLNYIYGNKTDELGFGVTLSYLF
jgi:hypothetical protein